MYDKYINACRAVFIFRKREIYLHFLTFINTEMVHVVEICPRQTRNDPLITAVYFTYIYIYIQTAVAGNLETQGAQASELQSMVIWFAQIIISTHMLTLSQLMAKGLNHEYSVLIIVSQRHIISHAMHWQASKWLWYIWRQRSWSTLVDLVTHGTKPLQAWSDVDLFPGPVLLALINFNPSMKHMSSKVWNEITDPFLNLNGCAHRWSLGMDK